jgi:hypothetical protein
VPTIRDPGHDDEAAVDGAQDQAEGRRRRRPGPRTLLWPSIKDAEITLVRAIIEPIDRSIPPAMTTIA